MRVCMAKSSRFSFVCLRARSSSKLEPRSTNYNHRGVHVRVCKCARRPAAQALNESPSVFMEAAQVDLTTSILYKCAGVDADSGRHLHCWITDCTIPLNGFCRDDDTIKDRCSLAAFCCILRAALYGLHLSDWHFFNFGVQLTENATAHLVVIIDAGSRGIHRDVHWMKSEINTTVMHKFRKACAEESTTIAMSALKQRQRHGIPGHS